VVDSVVVDCGIFSGGGLWWIQWWEECRPRDLVVNVVAVAVAKMTI
jgi:hypothetical protein